MRIIKIEHNELLNAVGTEYALHNAGVKQTRLDNAVIAESTPENTNTITNVMVENKGFEIDEPTQYDIDMLNSK